MGGGEKKILCRHFPHAPHGAITDSSMISLNIRFDFVFKVFSKYVENRVRKDIHVELNVLFIKPTLSA